MFTLSAIGHWFPISLLAILPLALSSAASAADPAPGPLPPDQAVKAMKVSEGFVATLVAAEPDVVQPISFCFDDRGRMWVAEALNYGAWQATGKDRIVILEDKDGDGRFETKTNFYEGFNYITGIEVGFGGVWVISPPNLYFVPDKDGDDKPDGLPQVLFDGFGYKESRHNLANGFTWGPDGWLYAGHGRTSPSDVGRPGTPKEQRIHCDGGVYRIHPTKLIFENFADGTTNPWGVDFNDVGQCFVSNCVTPHLFHMIQGGHYEPWRNRASSQFAYERLPTCADHLHYAGANPLVQSQSPETKVLGGGHAHCGTLIYKGDSFPAEYRNTVLMCNLHGKRINNDILKPKGSGYTASHGSDFMLAGDPWFMGVTLRTGPNGAVYVSDWSDTGECHTLKPHVENGRIYSVSFGPPRPVSVDLAKLSDEELVKLQSLKNDWFVTHTRRLLQERAAQLEWDGAAVHAALRNLLTKENDESLRLHALWALHVTHGFEGPKAIPSLQELLDDRGEHVRGWAVQIFCEGNLIPKSAISKFADMAQRDPSPVVRLALASALQRLPVEQRWDIAAGLIAHEDDRDDANLPLMDWYGMEPLVVADPERMLRLGAAAKIPLVRRFIARRLAEFAAPKGNLGPLIATLGQAEASIQRDLLQGILEGLRGSNNLKAPTVWQEVYPKLKDHTDPKVRDSAAALAVIFGDARAVAALRAKILNSTTPAAERQSALETLIEKRPADLAATLQELLADKSLRRIALRGLAAVPHADTAKQILSHYSDFSGEEKQEALATLASRKDFAGTLLDAVEKKSVPHGDISAFLARQICTLGDPSISERLQKVWGVVRDSQPDKQAALAKYKTLLTPDFLRDADPSHGRLIYSKNCQQCHLLFGAGNNIGPDLTGGNRANLDYILSNILDPSAEIGLDYRLSIVATTKGRVITGIILERTPVRLTVQTATDRVILPVSEVDAFKESDVSLMPEGQLDKLSKEEIRDLIAYLAAKQQVPLPAEARE